MLINYVLEVMLTGNLSGIFLSDDVLNPIQLTIQDKFCIIMTAATFSTTFHN